jgi:hypothetical protein
MLGVFPRGQLLLRCASFHRAELFPHIGEIAFSLPCRNCMLKNPKCRRPQVSSIDWRLASCMAYLKSLVMSLTSHEPDETVWLMFAI